MVASWSWIENKGQHVVGRCSTGTTHGGASAYLTPMTFTTQGTCAGTAPLQEFEGVNVKPGGPMWNWLVFGKIWIPALSNPYQLSFPFFPSGAREKKKWRALLAFELLPLGKLLVVLVPAGPVKWLILVSRLSNNFDPKLKTLIELYIFQQKRKLV
jgi:hypothetical protein